MMGSTFRTARQKVRQLVEQPASELQNYSVPEVPVHCTCVSLARSGCPLSAESAAESVRVN